MPSNTAHKFQDNFYESLFGDPADLFDQSDHDVDSFNARLTVYRRNVFGSLTDVLSSTFSHVAKVLDTETFQKIAHSFIRQHLPAKGLLNAYGEDFPEFLKNQKGIPPWNRDLATLEWKLQASYYAEDTPPLTQEQLAAISPEDIPFLVFEPSPTLQLFHVEEEVLKDYCRENFQEGFHNFYHVEGSFSGYGIITRQDFRTTLTWVDKTLYHFLALISKKSPLSKVLDQLLTKSLDLDVTLLLGTSFRLGCFSNYKKIKQAELDNDKRG